MELGYLRRLHLATADRISFGERGRPAGKINEDREALEQTANALDELARCADLSGDVRRVAKEAAVRLMQAGY